MQNQVNKQKIWDPFLRSFHWLLALCFGIAYYLEGSELVLHSHLGYCVGLLLLFRLIWGFIGPEHARFFGFAPNSRELLAHLRDLSRPHSGHDPLGALMIFALLLTLTVLVVTGIIMFALEGRGPMPSYWVSGIEGSLVEEVHSLSAEIAFWLVVLHIIGVLIMSGLTKSNLVLAMLTGNKRETPQ